jgi:Zn-dependent peptidase ImmA (M78 family)
MYFRCEDGDIEIEKNGRRSRPRAEILADRFAAHLLMPEALVREVWRKAFDERDAAEMLMVSLQAMRIRLSQLRLQT